MRWLLLLVLIGAFLALVGVISFHHSHGHETININTEEVHKMDKDVGKALKEGEHMFEKTPTKAGQAKTATPARTGEPGQAAPAGSGVPAGGSPHD
jgi:hypothetical protein